MQRTVISGTADGSLKIERQQMANTKLRREMKKKRKGLNGDGWFTTDRVITQSLQWVPEKATKWLPITIISKAEQAARAFLLADCFILAVLAVSRINRVRIREAAAFVNELRGQRNISLEQVVEKVTQAIEAVHT